MFITRIYCDVIWPFIRQTDTLDRMRRFYAGFYEPEERIGTVGVTGSQERSPFRVTRTGRYFNFYPVTFSLFERVRG